VSCPSLKLVSPFVGSCFKHVMSKATQYATHDSKVCQGIMEMSLKQSQTTFQKTITWIKKSAK
jgi:hypothetical protein